MKTDIEKLKEKLELFVDENVDQHALQIVGRLIRRSENGRLTEHDKDLIFMITSFDETKDSKNN